MPIEKLSRRKLLVSTAAAGAVALAAPAIIGPTRAQSKTLYINTWGGGWTEAEEAAFFKPFTAETGIEVRAVTPVSFAKLKAQVETQSYEWDITIMGQDELLRAKAADLVEPVDYNLVDKSKLYDGAIWEDGFCYCSLGTNLVYRKDKFPNGGPQNWADFWNVEKFPGARAMYNDPVRALVFALLADGVEKDKLYPLDVDRAFKKLDEIKPHIKVWWTGGNQSQQLLRDGEADTMVMWNARASQLAKDGVPVEVVWDGANLHTTMWIVAKGAPNKDLAWQFLQFASQAKPQAEFCNMLYYGPANPNAFEFISPENAAQMPTFPANEKQGVWANSEWIAANTDAIEERFTTWLAG